MNTSAAIAAYRAARQQMSFTKLHWGVANAVGIQSALFIEIIQDWCDNNMIHQRKQYFHDDYWWTKGTYQEWETKYPALGSARTLQRLLLSLESDGYVLSDQFHKGKDNTKFYRVNEEKIGELYLRAIDEFRKSNVPNWHGESEVSKTSCQNGTTSVPICHGHDANLAHSSIYKQINELDQKIDQSPLTPQGETGEGETISHVEVEIVPQGVTPVVSPVAEIKNEPLPSQEGLCTKASIPAAAEDQFFKPLTGKNPKTGKEYLPWQGVITEGRKSRTDNNPAFVLYIAGRISNYSKYENLPMPELLIEANKYINSTYKTGRVEELEDSWRKFCERAELPDVSAKEIKHIAAVSNLKSMLADRLAQKGVQI